MTQARWLSKIILLFVCALAIPNLQAETSSAKIIDTVTTFLERETQNHLQQSKIQGRYSVEIGRLDSRLRMPGCTEPLNARLESPTQPVGRVTVKVRCDDHAPWSIFVSAHVHLFRDVVVSTRPLKRNALLNKADITMAERDVASLKLGYLTSIEEAVGSQLTRAIPADQPITPNQLRLPALIKRGDQVVISAISGVISVRMQGEALTDGGLGEQIRVRNLRSKKVIFARVTAAGQVEVDM